MYPNKSKTKMNQVGNETMLVIVKAIYNFTKSLGEMFESKQRSLKLYCRLINKTTLSHEKPLQKHVDAFRKFCIANRPAIREQNVSLLNKDVDRIVYSSNVFIDMSHIFKLSDKESEPVIWKHLLYISALVDPAGKAKEILKANMNSKKDNKGDVKGDGKGDGKGDNKESNFLSDIIDKVEQHVDPNSTNPMEAVTSIMQSGVFTDLISGMNSGLSDGNLDLGKLMGAVQGMVSTISTTVGSDPQTSGALGMLTSMMGNLGPPPPHNPPHNLPRTSMQSTSTCTLETIPEQSTSVQSTSVQSTSVQSTSVQSTSVNELD